MVTKFFKGKKNQQYKQKAQISVGECETDGSGVWGEFHGGESGEKGEAGGHTGSESPVIALTLS